MLREILTILGILVVLGGWTASYATTQVELSGLTAATQELRVEYEQYKQATEMRLLNIQLDVAKNTQQLADMKEDICEIKAGIKELLGRSK